MTFSLRAFLPLILFLALAGMLAIGLTKDPSELKSQMIDRPVPDFALTALYDEGEIITQDALLGQVSLLNVFGSWCVACVQEHPALVQISAQNEVRLIGIDWRDKRASAKNWLQRYGDPYDQIIFDSESTLAVQLGITGAPETFIVDKAGNIRYKHIGIITPQIWRETLLPIVQDLKAAS